MQAKYSRFRMIILIRIYSIFKNVCYFILIYSKIIPVPSISEQFLKFRDPNTLIKIVTIKWKMSEMIIFYSRYSSFHCIDLKTIVFYTRNHQVPIQRPFILAAKLNDLSHPKLDMTFLILKYSGLIL